MSRNNNPMRLQRTRQKGRGFVFPEGEYNDRQIVVVSRPSKWSNPYKVGMVAYSNGEEIQTIQEAVMLYEHYITVEKPEIAEEAKTELKGKNLACWCKLGTPCHADILLKIANE